MRTIILSVIVTSACFLTHAQPIANAEASLTFVMMQGGGANGLGVAYNPSKKIYYCAIAGNADFPLECFSNEENIYEGSMGFDARGFWFNAKTNSLEGNSYGGEGIYVFSLDAEGKPTGTPEKKFTGGQPNEQSVGAYDPGSDLIYYFEYTTGEVTPYKRTSGKKGKVIKLQGCPADFQNLNSAMIYTGQKNAEMGFYDFVDAKIYLFSKKGEYQSTVLLPEDAPYNELFNFSYANGYAFLFDKDMREWVGYKIFK